MKTADLINAGLDLAVAQLMGYSNYCPQTDRVYHAQCGWVNLCDLNYSTSWSKAGPIIEREEIWLCGPHQHRADWKANHGKAPSYDFTKAEQLGPTPLIAAMRCFVASKLGDEVAISEGLK